MSRTKGTGDPNRHANDEYITPDWCVRRLLEKFPVEPASICWDPCASRGELITAARGCIPNSWFATEINPDHKDALQKVVPDAEIRNFLEMEPFEESSKGLVIITNPPYFLAEEFIKHSLKFATTVVMLLRLNFLASKTRRGWLAGERPEVLVLPNRPSFDGKGTDGCEYGWFVFGEGCYVSRGRLSILTVSSVEEIKAWNKKARGSKA